MAPLSASAGRWTLRRCLSKCEAALPARHPDWAHLSRLARLSRQERPAAGPGSEHDRRRRRVRAAACTLDANLHGSRGAVPGVVLSFVPARRAARQADGRQRLDRRDRTLSGVALWAGARGARRRHRGRGGDLGRGQPIRGLFRVAADGHHAIPRRQYSSDPGGDYSLHAARHGLRRRIR